MLALNGKKVDFSDKKNPLVKSVLDVQNILKKRFGEKVHVDFAKNLYTSALDDRKREIREHPAGIAVRSTLAYSAKNFSGEVTYYESSRLDKGGAERFFPTTYLFEGKRTLDLETNFDEIFFLMCVVPTFQPLDYLLEYQTTKRRKVTKIRLIDVEAEATEDLSEKRLISEVTTMITSNEYGIKDKDLKAFAEMYGVNTDNKSNDLIRQQLLGRVMRRGVNGRYEVDILKEFKESVRTPDVVNMKGTIKEAIRREILVLEENAGPQKKNRYSIFSDGKKVVEFCSLNRLVKPIDGLMDFVTENPEKLKDLEEIVEKSRK